MFLEKIVRAKEIEVERKKRRVPITLLEEKINLIPPRDFKYSIKRKEFSLIAEIKKASPIKGILKEDFNPLKIAKIYEKNGAGAISVLTDRKFFKGDINWIRDIKEICKLPILRKDFIIDEYQIYESRAKGADAILLIASLLNLRTLKKFLRISKELGMDCLVEVHTKEEQDLVLKTPTEILGINNRNLRTFEVDIKTTLNLIKFIPNDKIVVSESGIKTREDVIMLKNAGVDVILVGETLIRSRNIGKKIRELFN